MGSKMSTASREGESEQNSETKEKLERHMQENGLTGIEKIFNEELEKWKDIKIKFGVTGNSGVGKSSFINAIRNLPDDDPNAAEVNVTECTSIPENFPYPSNENIELWDLPGTGTPTYPDLNTYCKMVNFETYDTFLIIAASRFTNEDFHLAKKIKSMKKKFFFIRTKIDDNVRSEKKKKTFDENAVLESIRHDCIKNLDDLVDNVEDIYLISNHDPEKWDFARLIDAILDVLPTRQRESLTLTLRSFSDDILQRKIKILKRRMWIVAAASAAAALVPIPALSISVDLVLIISETTFYRYQFGLPEKDSEKFSKLTDICKVAIRKLWFFAISEITPFMVDYVAESVVQEAARFIPLVGPIIGSGMAFATTSYFLRRYLSELEVTAKLVLDEIESSTSSQAFDFD